MGSCPVSKSARRYTNRSTTTTTTKNLHTVVEMRKNKESTNESKTTTRRPFCTTLLTTAPRHRSEGHPLLQNRVTDVRRTKTLFVCMCVPELHSSFLWFVRYFFNFLILMVMMVRSNICNMWRLYEARTKAKEGSRIELLFRLWSAMRKRTSQDDVAGTGDEA